MNNIKFLKNESLIKTSLLNKSMVKTLNSKESFEENKAISNKKVILVVSFGTSYNDTRDITIGAIEEDIKKTYTDYEIRRAFTSQIIINKLKTRDKIEIDNVTQAMEKLVKDKFNTVICQPTHVMNGYEYDDMLKDVNIFKGKFKNLTFGTPLLTSVQDYKNIVNAINEEIPKLNTNDAIVFMGHGTEHFANATYAALDYQFKENGNKNIFVGTVESYPDLYTLLKQIKKLNPKKIYLMPLMVVAGDHANNDMAGNHKGSWKTTFESEGFEVEPILKGLGEYKTVRKIYVEHVKKAIELIEK